MLIFEFIQYEVLSPLPDDAVGILKFFPDIPMKIIELFSTKLLELSSPNMNLNLSKMDENLASQLLMSLCDWSLCLPTEYMLRITDSSRSLLFGVVESVCQCLRSSSAILSMAASSVFGLLLQFHGQWPMSDRGICGISSNSSEFPSNRSTTLVVRNNGTLTWEPLAPGICRVTTRNFGGKLAWDVVSNGEKSENPLTSADENSLESGFSVEFPSLAKDALAELVSNVISNGPECAPDGQTELPGESNTVEIQK